MNNKNEMTADLKKGTTRWRSPAKLNLFLRVIGRRKDGFHNLQSVFQLIDLYDEIDFRPRPDGKISRTFGNHKINESDDLIIRAAKLMKAFAKTPLGVEIDIRKNIPLGGGLGGGSSNAATTIHALNRIWNLRLDLKTLMAIGLKLGADVPFFLLGKSAFASGVGEILTPLTLPRHHFLVVDPNAQLSTRAVFSHQALTMSRKMRKIPPVRAFCEMHNDCLAAAVKMKNEIAVAINWLERLGHKLGKVRMSGTGSCVFAEFENREDALSVQQKLPAKWRGFVVRGMNISPLHWAVAKR